MRHASAGRRPRNRGNGGGRRGGQNKAQVFDSNGPDVRIRGTAYQIFEKYEALAKDALSSGDVILAESYSQHAEHYQRIIGAYAENVQNRNADQNTYNREADGNRNKAKEEDDLSLPSSILGGSSKAKTEDSDADKSAQKTLEDA